jgi:hypothetical protein
MPSDEAEKVTRIAIKNPYRVDKDQVLLHLWMLPVGRSIMDGNAVGWTILSEKNGQRYDVKATYMVQRVRWDIMKAKPPIFASLDVQKITLDSVQFLKHIAKARQTPIPLVGFKAGRGRDGAFYGMQVVDDYGGFSLTWWSAAPEEWQPIRKWLHTFTNYLDNHFSKQPPSQSKPEQA